MFAAGMSTWNSVEFSDAAKGACYSKLRCIDCHEPHRALGRKWTPPPERDDAVCLKCHDTFREADRRAAHTHHTAGSAGDRCLNCHMPRINEGLQDVVRTHMIYSPTRADMLQANHPNACNLCHTDRSIDWTLDYLKKWYAKSYDEREISLHYHDRNESVAIGWLSSQEQSVRLVAADALIRSRNIQALPKLIDVLDDPYLLNRQFTAKGLEEMLGVRLGDYGYRFYQTHMERVGPLANIRAKTLSVPRTK
jgi:predicted CXXCH cytochrome family protein